MPPISSASSFTRLTRLALVAAAAAALALIATAAPTPAHAAEDGTITWSVRPADEHGPDGRSWVEQELDPGASVVEHLAVRNLSNEIVTFGLVAADGYFTDKGRFSMLPAGEESIDAGTWIDVAESVTVEAGQTVVVPFSVTVPERAEPGDHAAGIAASIRSVQSAEGTQLGVESRVGFRVMTRVAGVLAPSLDIAATAADYRLSWNPFQPGAVTVAFDVVNTGNIRLDVRGSVEVGEKGEGFPVSESAAVALLPGDRQRVTVVLDEVWPLGLVSADILATPSVIASDGSDSVAIDSVTERVGVWVMPWPQLIVLLGLALIVTAIVAGRLRSRHRVAALVAAARAEGEDAARVARSEADDARRIDDGVAAASPANGSNVGKP